MFRVDQIITATMLIKKFRQVRRYLNHNPEALLIIQKGADPLVLLNAELYEELLVSKLKTDGLEVRESCLRTSLRQI